MSREYEDDDDLGLFLEVWNSTNHNDNDYNIHNNSNGNNNHSSNIYNDDDVDLPFMEFDDDNNNENDINYLDDFIPVTSSSSLSSSSLLSSPMKKISQSVKTKTKSNKKNLISSSIPSPSSLPLPSPSLLPSSPAENMTSNDDVTNTKTLLFGNSDGKIQFTFPSIDIFPAVISGPWNDANYYGSDDEEDDDDNTNNDKKKRKRQRSKNPDYDLITIATETNLKLLHIKPDSKEGKAERRRIRNKLSAQMHRERKKAYIVYLESIVRHRESTIINLNENMDKLKRENEQLKAYFASNNQTLKTKNHEIDYTTESITSSDDEDAVSENSKSNIKGVVASVSSPLSESSSASFRSKFSLFSILFMFGFTFFGPFNPTNTSSMGTSVRLFQPPSLLGYSTVVNSNSLLQLAPPTDFPDYIDSSTKSSGRVLLSLPSELPNETEIKGPLPKLNITPLNPIISKSKALWKYQDRVLHLFPKLSLPNSLGNKKRHLRSRDSHPSSSDYETALVPFYSTSRVLLTEGKALLDPVLATGRVINDNTGSGDQKTGSSLALSTWTSPYNHQSHPSNSIVSVRAENSNLLVMLLPANQIRWGKSWEDGKDTISSGLDFSTDNIDGYSKDDIDSAWVEIGCSVFKAQLVKNITMM